MYFWQRTIIINSNFGGIQFNRPLFVILSVESFFRELLFKFTQRVGDFYNQFQSFIGCGNDDCYVHEKQSWTQHNKYSNMVDLVEGPKIFMTHDSIILKTLF